MRKIYQLAGLACLGLVLSSQNTNAQSVSDFEALTLNAESAFDGSDLSGVTTPTNFTTNFLSGDASFVNVWDSAWGGPGYWKTGFAQSTYTDVTTSGAPNKYSAIAGSGNNSSLTYLVSNNNSKFTLKNTASDSIVNSIYITNGTYAYNSMRDGDSFAKKFGGATGDDQDWFLLTIKGADSTGNLTTDSVNFYLADYRFTDNNQDYIVNTWQQVDLTSLGRVVSLTFTLTSSDVGTYGMNTPSFFCIDDIEPKSANLINFEDLGFTVADNVWDGSDYSGTPNDLTYRTTFADGDAEFKNVYSNGSYAYWKSGFAYSNVTDNTTSGAGNKYSAIAGQGANLSNNYLVSQNKSKIFLTGSAANNTVAGTYITNTTYAANSMRDGDSFAKKFGGATGDDEDWFLVTIKGYTGGYLTTDSVNFYLADYRFSDNTEDYIVNDWQWVNLTSLGNVDSLSFVLSSSDVGNYGMNTPAFFALDNFNDQSVSVNELAQENSFSIYPNPAKNFININLSNTIESLQIIDVTGKVILSENNLKTGTHQINTSNLSTGVYFVKTTTNNTTSVVRLIKQ